MYLVSSKSLLYALIFRRNIRKDVIFLASIYEKKHEKTEKFLSIYF